MHARPSTWETSSSSAAISTGSSISGVRWIDWSYGVDACALVEPALRAMRRDEAADGWAQRHREQLDLGQRVMAERTQLHARDDLVPTGLPPEVQEAIVARCREAGWVAALWIARKNLVTVPASSDFVAVKPKLFAFASQNRLVRLADAIGGGIAVARLYEERDLMRRLDSLGARRRLR